MEPLSEFIYLFLMAICIGAIGFMLFCYDKKLLRRLKIWYKNFFGSNTKNYEKNISSI